MLKISTDTLIRRLLGIFDVANEGLLYMDSAGKTTYYNKAFYKRFDLEIENSDLDDWLKLVHPLDKEKLDVQVQDHFARGAESRKVTQYRVKSKSGGYLWIEGTGVVKHEDGEEYMLCSHKDISDQKLMEEYVYQAAYFDSHSGLYNRKKLIFDVNDAQHDTTKTIFYISIQNMKSYVNQYSEDILDEVVDHVIASFSVFSKFDAQFYRLTPDEFAVLVENDITDEQIKILCDSCIQKYHQLSDEEGLLYGEQMSIGAYSFKSGEVVAKEILRRASRTTEYVKEKVERGWVIYDESIEAQVERYFYIEKELKKAIMQKELSVHYQPIISTESRNIVSFEALVRWKNTEIGNIYPNEFIPVAEKKGMIFELGNMVMEKASQFIKQYNKVHNTNIRININVSVLQLLNSSFIDHVKQIVESVKVPYHSIVLELTETVALDGNIKVGEQLKELSKLGLNIALDDFGAGYSSLNSFFTLPLNQIKIDRSLVVYAMESSEPREYLKFLHQMCSEKDVSVVVEGIETSDMVTTMTAIGLTTMQGFWFAKPLDATQALNFKSHEIQIAHQSNLTYHV